MPEEEELEVAEGLDNEAPEDPDLDEGEDDEDAD